MKNLKTEIRWGILFSLVSMAWMFIEVQFLDWHDRYISSQFGNHFIILLILFAIIYYFALREKREHYYKGKITWKQALASGVIISVVITLLSPLTEYFNYHYVSPNYFDSIIDYQVHKEHPMTQESAESLFNMKSFLIQAIFTNLSFGFMASILLGLVVRKK